MPADAARDALERLRQGNARFVSGRDHGRRTGRSRLLELSEGQSPFAIILGCSDSRVPAEIVFDQGVGDLFVIRVAGHIVAPSQIGSVEFAADQFGTRLVVVLGHSECGAVAATLQELERPSDLRSPNLASIVDRIRPAVEGLLADASAHERDTLMALAVRANIRAAADRLRHGSAILERLIADEGLRVVGAEYSLRTGVVDFLDDASGSPESD